MSNRVEHILFTVIGLLFFPVMLGGFAFITGLFFEPACGDTCDELVIGLCWIAAPFSAFAFALTYRPGVLVQYGQNVRQRSRGGVGCLGIFVLAVAYIFTGLTLISTSTSPEWSGIVASCTLYAGIFGFVFGYVFSGPDSLPLEDAD